MVQAFSSIFSLLVSRGNSRTHTYMYVEGKVAPSSVVVRLCYNSYGPPFKPALKLNLASLCEYCKWIFK